MTIKRVGIVGSGIMGSGIAEVAAKAGLRGRPAQPRAGTRRRDGRRAREVARQAGRAGQARGRRARRGARPGARRHRPRRARRLRPRDRVDRRGPRREEAPLHRARPHLRRRRDPRDQHVDAAGRRDGDGDRPPRPGVRRPLLQPRADDGARRGRARDHDVRRDDRRRPRAFATTCGKNAVQVKDQAGLHRQRAAVPVPQQRGEAVRRRRRDPRRHRRRDEGRLQLPDGPARAARPRRPRHEPRDPRSALRRVQGPELRAGPAPAPDGRAPSASAARRGSASTTTAK